jgi:hypothetical protein
VAVIRHRQRLVPQRHRGKKSRTIRKEIKKIQKEINKETKERTRRGGG